MDDVKALFALFAMAIFGNAFDKRTYMPLIFTVDGLSEDELKAQKEADVNAIPPLERQHYCHTRGLAFDLIHWFFNHYSLEKPNEEADDAYGCILAPFIAELGHKVIQYKFAAQENKRPGVCNGEEFEHQVKMALSIKAMHFPFNAVESFSPSFEFDFDDYSVTALATTKNDYPFFEDFLGAGKNDADETYFAALGGQFYP